MRTSFFEDTTIADPNRAVAGIGPGATDGGTTNVNVPAEAQRDDTDAPKILPFQIQNAVPTVAKYITDLMIMRNDLESIAKNSDTDESKRIIIDKLVKRINKINTIFATDVIKLLDRLAL